MVTGLFRSYTKISRKKKFRISKNILIQISVNSNLAFRGLLCETQGAGLHVSEWKILIRNKTMSCKKLLQRKFKYFMIIYRSLTQKTPFEASLF